MPSQDKAALTSNALTVKLLRLRLTDKWRAGGRETRKSDAEREAEKRAWLRGSPSFAARATHTASILPRPKGERR